MVRFTMGVSFDQGHGERVFRKIMGPRYLIKETRWVLVKRKGEHNPRFILYPSG